MNGGDDADDINAIRMKHGDKAARDFFDNAKSFELPGGHIGSSLPSDGISIDDFHAYLPAHSYIYRPTREMWPGSSVNAKILPVAVLDERGDPVLNANGSPKRMSAAAWLDANKSVEQMTWAPGERELIKDRHIIEGGFIERKGATTFNLYRPPTLVHGNADKAGRWLDHVCKVYPDDAEHIIHWLAHRVQRPQEKINHALLLGGEPGIGKDSIFTPVKYAVGPWNFQEVSPTQVLGRFNSFIRSVIIRISEVRDTGDVDRFAFYEHVKTLAAEPPETLRIDEKHLREYSVLNCTAVAMTTNHKLDGLYLPSDDRRHYVAWSDLTRGDFPTSYWISLHQWYLSGGNGHVAAYLANLDLSDFDAKAPPRKTQAFWAIVHANNAPEDAELADALDRLGNPKAVTLEQVACHADGDFAIWLRDRKNRRTVGYRFEKCGYTAARNEDAKDGLWKINDKRQAIYTSASLSVRERYQAAQQLAGQRVWR